MVDLTDKSTARQFKTRINKCLSGTGFGNLKVVTLNGYGSRYLSLRLRVSGDMSWSYLEYGLGLPTGMMLRLEKVGLDVFLVSLDNNALVVFETNIRKYEERNKRIWGLA